MIDQDKQKKNIEGLTVFDLVGGMLPSSLIGVIGTLITIIIGSFALGSWSVGLINQANKDSPPQLMELGSRIEAVAGMWSGSFSYDCSDKLIPIKMNTKVSNTGIISTYTFMHPTYGYTELEAKGEMIGSSGIHFSYKNKKPSNEHFGSFVLTLNRSADVFEGKFVAIGRKSNVSGNVHFISCSKSVINKDNFQLLNQC